MFIATDTETGARVQLDRATITAICPDCGKEHEVDLIELAHEFPHFDLYGTEVFCPECANRRRK